MPRQTTASYPVSESDLAYQKHILQGVSRTFALTIPQLPEALCDVVGNAYLLCRIADTIEDDTALSSVQKDRYARYFSAVVEGGAAARDFALELAPLLGNTTLPAERDLVANTPCVMRITHSFSATQQAALLRCVRTMSSGMAQFQRNAGTRGLADLSELDKYCYYVAGVVGEMLTDLFCEYSPDFAAHGQAHLQKLAVSFGQGLQMTNILKDIWDDLGRGVCWLPRDIFCEQGFDLSHLQRGVYEPAFGEGLARLIGIARLHLRNALDYILLIPAEEKGMRRFCLWAVGMALLTLRNINRRRDFSSGAQVKISRRSVKAVVFTGNVLTAQDKALDLLFRLFSRSLPQTPAVETEKPRKTDLSGGSTTIFKDGA